MILEPDWNGHGTLYFSGEAVRREDLLILLRRKLGGAVLTVGERSAFAVKLSHSGRCLAVGGQGGTVLLWQTAQLASGPIQLIGHVSRETVGALAFTPDDTALATGSTGIYRLWFFDSHKNTWAANAECQMIPSPTQLAPTIPLNPSPKNPFEGSAADIAALNFSADGRWLLVGTGDMQARHDLSGEVTWLAGEGIAQASNILSPCVPTIKLSVTEDRIDTFCSCRRTIGECS